MAGNSTRGEAQNPFVFDLALNRRTFLGATGSLAATAAYAQTPDPTPPKFERGADGIVRMARLFGAERRVWEIDPNWFFGDEDPWSRHSSEDESVRLIGTGEVRIAGRFAGSNLPANLTVKVRAQGGQWLLAWKFDGNAEQTIEVGRWFSGIPLSKLVKLSPLDDTAGGSAEFRSSLSMSVAWPMRLEAAVPAGVGFRLGPTSGKARRVVLEPYGDAAGSGPTPAPHVLKVLAAGSVHKMRVSITDLTLSAPGGGWLVGKVGDSTLRWSPEHAEVRIETAWIPARRAFATVWRLGTNGAAHLQIGDPDRPRSILLSDEAEQIEVGGTIDDPALRHGFLFGLAAEPRAIQGLRYAATVRGRGVQLVTGLQGADTVEVPVTLLVLHARGGDAARYDVDFRAFSPGQHYLDRSAINWRTTPQSAGVDAILTLGRRPTAPPAGNHLHLGTESGAQVALHRPGATTIGLDSPVLRARRHHDALDQGFLFQDCVLQIDNNGTRLIGSSGTQRGLRFHPQHLQEEAFTTPPRGEETSLLTWAGGLMGQAVAFVAPPKVEIRALGSVADSEYAEAGVGTKLARTRVAGASRVIFKPRKETQIELTVDALTRFDGLKISAIERMANARKSLDEQIESLGIKIDTDRKTARDLVNAQFVVPPGNKTFLEMVTGNGVSLDEGGRLRVPRRAPDADLAIWTAQVELLPIDALKSEPGQVRAIWADGLDSSSVIAPPGCVDRPVAANPPFETSLGGRDGAEIVMLSSGLAIASMRALSETGKDVPASLVRLPKKAFAYVDQTDRAHPKDPGGQKYRQEGVMAPAPFSRFGARLTAFGGDLDAEWSGEPAAPWADGAMEPFFNRAFSVERYVHRTSLGSDMFVEVVYKGFLFPYGFRVALLMITQREAHVVSGLGAMMPSIKRYFIVPKPVAKSMPGIYQPFDGLEIPVRRAELVQRRSPELDPWSMTVPPEITALMKSATPAPTPSPTGPAPKWPTCPPESLEPRGQIFWPRLYGRKGKPGKEIAFDFMADGTGVARSVPMLFMDNAAVHDAPTVRAVIAYYNTVVGEDLRTELHHGGQTIFGAPAESGDTSFETEQIVLRSRSRMIAATAPAPPGPLPATLSNDPDLAQYQMDAFMEGADEPPFYPVMEEARIKVPPLDRLLGEPQGFKRVGYNENYVRNGFDKRGNPSTLYLNFLDPGGIMQLGGRGEISGGVAQTPTPVSGISRANAIVGAPAKESARTSAAVVAAFMPMSAAQQRAASQPPVGADHVTPWDLAEVVGNLFNPRSFFKLPKVLGVIDIGEAVLPTLMEKQPKLKEVYDYALDKKGEAEDAIAKAFGEVAGQAAALIEKALDEAEEKLVEFLRGEKIPTLPGRLANLLRFYPDLTARLDGLAGTLKALKAVTTIADITKSAKRLTEEWRSVRGAVDAVIANPTPEPVRGIIKDLRAVVDKLSRFLGTTLADAVKTAADDLVAKLIAPVRDAILDLLSFDVEGNIVNRWVFEAFFGPIPATIPNPTRAQLIAQVDVVLRSKDVLPVGLAGAPLAQAFTLPLLRILARARDLGDQVANVTTATLAHAAEAALGVLREMVEGLEGLVSLADTARTAAAAACTAATQPLTAIVNLAFEGAPASQTIVTFLKDTDRRLVVLTLPRLPSSPAVDVVRDAVAGLSGSVQRLADQLAGVKKARDAWIASSSQHPTWCTDPGRMPSVVADLNKWRRASVDAIEECARQSGRVGDALVKLAQSEQQQAAEAFAELPSMLKEMAVLARDCTLARLATGANEASSTLASRLSVLPTAAVSRLAEARAQAFRLAAEANAVLAAMPASPTGEDVVRFVLKASPVAEAERLLLSLATDFTAVQGQVLAKIDGLTRGLASTVTDPLIELHDDLLEQADDVITAVKAQPDIIAMLTGPLLGRLVKIRDALEVDLRELRQVAATPSKAGALVARWRREQPGLVQAARTIVELFDAVASGQIGALFDLASARRAIEDAVRRLIPSRVTLTYDWDAEVTAVPAGNPVFRPGTAASPHKKGQSNLKIATRIEVDLLRPQDRKMKVEGTLAPFTIHLLGPSLDLLEIEFKDTKFESDGRGGPDFRTTIDQVRIGKELQFLQLLQTFMQKRNGLSVLPSFAPPGINVGYSVGEPKIQLPGLTFLNVALSVSAWLPFSGDKALFRFAFASREAPFGVIVDPYYYGGGFVALEADATGIVAFEIQLEFGAAREFKFGPMSGFGKIATGIYMLTGNGGRRLEGFVHALGEGHIACFGITVNIEVTVRSEGSSMKGEAEYSYSFSVGLATLSYSFTASYEFSGGSKVAPALAARPGASALAAGPSENYRLTYVDRRQDWKAWRQRFISDWPDP